MSSEPQRPQPPRRPRRDRRARWRAGLGPLDWWLDKLVQVEEAIEAAMGSEGGGNSAGVAALIMRAGQARDKLDDMLASSPDMLEGAPPEEVAAWLRTALEEWPDQHLEEVFRVYSVRHKGRILFVSEGGHRATYSGDEGWIREVGEK